MAESDTNKSSDGPAVVHFRGWIHAVSIPVA